MANNKDITDEFLNYRGVMSALLGRLKSVSPCDIEDILQETYVRTYQSALKSEIHYPKAFMVKTALRLANRRQQQENRTQSVAEIEDLDALRLNDPYQDSRFDPEQDTIKLKEFELMCAAINQLPVKCRRVLILKKIYGLSQKEIAEQLAISQSTVEKHVAKGLLQCTRFIDDYKRNSDNTKLPIAGLPKAHEGR